MYLHIVLGILSGLFWLWFFFVKTSFRGKFPAIIKIFFWGMVAASVAGFVEGMIFRLFPFIHESSNKIFSLLSMFFVVAPLEEYTKCFALESTVYKTNDFDSPKNGIVFAIACALGFGAFENIFYFLRYGFHIVLIRSFLSLLGHASFSGIMGYYMGIGKQVKEQQQKYVVIGLIAAVLLHGLYNFLISTNTALSFLIYPLVLGIILFLEYEINQQTNDTKYPQGVKLYFVLIPVLLISLGTFFLKNRQDAFYEGKNIIAYENIYKLYNQMTPFQVERVLGAPSYMKEFFGRNEMFYVYYYKDVMGDYKVLKLVFIKDKLSLEESF